VRFATPPHKSDPFRHKVTFPPTQGCIWRSRGRGVASARRGNWSDAVGSGSRSCQPLQAIPPPLAPRDNPGAARLRRSAAREAAMDYKGKDWVERHRKEEFQRSTEQLARFNEEMEKVTPKPTPRQWIKDALVAVAIGLTCGVGTTFLWHLF